MKQVKISSAEAGQRLDKFLVKYLSKAPRNFIYKMLRKKNITLNNKKATGGEKIIAGDEIKLFLAEETIIKFSENSMPSPSVLPQAMRKTKEIDIVYEDEHVLFVNKPAGMLSQKAKKDDVSLVEYIGEYLMQHGEIRTGVRAGICNRLDRNTSGLVVAGKTIAGLQQMNELFKARTLDKFYLCIVSGLMEKEAVVDGYLLKDEKRNQVTILQESTLKEVTLKEAMLRKSTDIKAKPICTRYRPLSFARTNKGVYTLLEVKLITGRSHQIRAHLSAIGYPLIGDLKYGGKSIGGVKYQLLHAYRVVLPLLEGELAHLSKKTVIAKPSQEFEKVRKELGLNYGDVEFERT